MVWVQKRGAGESYAVGGVRVGQKLAASHDDERLLIECQSRCHGRLA